ncbi:MAG: LysR substrate-binding domain-containing protein [Thalassovita sp.]
MTIPRRFLPSVSSLRSLEAIERLGTAIAAADELALTHSAVSRQLKVLEDQLGVQMFVREGKKLSLTPAGTTYARSVRNYLQDLSQASLQLKASGSKSTLTLATLPGFAVYWLAPKLKTFQSQSPGLFVNQFTRLKPMDVSFQECDAAIHYGTQDWPGVHYLELAQDRVIPACAPDLFDAKIPAPAELQVAPLLHIESRPGAWETWFQTHGVVPDRVRGALFDQFCMSANAARHCQGVALLPDFIAEQEFAAGSLTPAAHSYTETDGKYYLVWPRSRPASASLKDLIEFLSA